MTKRAELPLRPFVFEVSPCVSSLMALVPEDIAQHTVQSALQFATKATALPAPCWR